MFHSMSSEVFYDKINNMVRKLQLINDDVSEKVDNIVDKSSNVKRYDNKCILTFDVPGIKQENINVSLKNDKILTVKAIENDRRYDYIFEIPNYKFISHYDMKLEYGVLTIILNYEKNDNCENIKKLSFSN